MNSRKTTIMIVIFIIIAIFISFFINRSQVKISDKQNTMTDNSKSDKIQKIYDDKLVKEDIVGKNANISIIFDQRNSINNIYSALDYGYFSGIFKKNQIDEVIFMYFDKDGKIRPMKNQNNLKKEKVKSKKINKTFYLGLFSNLPQQYMKDKSIRWIGTLNRGSLGYGMSASGVSIKNIGVQAEGDRMKLIGNMILSSFGLENLKDVNFISTVSDDEKLKMMESGKIDFANFKLYEKENQGKYDIVERKNFDYDPYNVFWIKSSKDKNEQEYIKRLMSSVDEIKKRIIADKDDYFKYIDANGSENQKKNKEIYYPYLVKSFDTEIVPDENELSKVFDLYFKLFGNKDNLKIKDFIYK